MRQIEDRALSRSWAPNSPAAFFLSSCWDCWATFETVRAHAAERAARRSRRMECGCMTCISLAKDVTLASHDTPAYTQRFIYTVQPQTTANANGKPKATPTTDMHALAARLEDSARQPATAAGSAAEPRGRTATVCEPLEARAISLAQQGRHKQAQTRALMESAGEPQPVQPGDQARRPDRQQSLAGCRCRPARPDRVPRNAGAGGNAQPHRGFAVGWAVQALHPPSPC